MNLYQKTEQFVVKTLDGDESDINHAKRTVYWVKQLKPDADGALLIAAISHDIERAIYGDWKRGSNNPVDLRKHQDLSAQEIEKFLRNENASEILIEKVRHLVSHHQEGGDDEQNVLCDADNLSFFEDKALRRVREHKEQGEASEIIKNRFDVYFSRFMSDKARNIAQKWYDKALGELEK
jgi:hypothetical protein